MEALGKAGVGTHGERTLDGSGHQIWISARKGERDWRRASEEFLRKLCSEAECEYLGVLHMS